MAALDRNRLVNAISPILPFNIVVLPLSPKLKSTGCVAAFARGLPQPSGDGARLAENETRVRLAIAHGLTGSLISYVASPNVPGGRRRPRDSDVGPGELCNATGPRMLTQVQSASESPISTTTSQRKSSVGLPVASSTRW